MVRLKQQAKKNDKRKKIQKPFFAKLIFFVLASESFKT